MRNGLPPSLNTDQPIPFDLPPVTEKDSPTVESSVPRAGEKLEFNAISIQEQVNHVDLPRVE